MPQLREAGPPVGPQVVFGLDEVGRCTLSTGAGLAALGVKPGELVGQNLYEVYRDVPGAVEALDRVLCGETFSLEREFEGRRLAIYYEALRGPDGTVTGAIGVTTDVTEQRRIEQEVSAARAREQMLGDLSVTLTREGLDSRALLLVAVRAVTEAVGEVGLLWLGGDDGRLEPRASCRAGSGPDANPETELIEADGGRVRLDLSEVAALHSPRVVDLADGAGPTPAELTTGGPTTYLRVPLRSRGELLGVIDVGRRQDRGPCVEADLDLVADVAERCAISLDNALLLDANGRALEQLIKLEALAEASDNLIGLTDTSGRIVYSNPRVRSFGIRLTHEDAWKTAAQHLGDATSAEIRDSLDREGRWSGDLRFTVEDGERFGHLAVFQLVHPGTGTPLGTGWIAEDTTELRSTEAALRTANADMKQFKALVEASPDFIAIAGLDGKVHYLNPGGRALIGLDPDVDVTTTSIADYLTPEGLAASVSVEQPAVIAHGHWEGESTLRSRRGPTIPVVIASFLMPDAETGEPFALATVQRDITEQRLAQARLRDLAEQRRTLLGRLVEAQDEERTRIAADVHDDPVQVLSAVDLRLGMLRRRLRERAPDLLEALEPLQVSVSTATDRLRALLFDLEPPDLQRGLAGALTRAAEEIFSDPGTAWTVDGDREPVVPDALRAIAYRIVKEAMHNARKHASASHVAVTVAGTEGFLEVSVADDGVGLGPGPVQASPGHRGLLNMQDRAAVAGGSCSVLPREGGGTLVRLRLPTGGQHLS